MIYIDSDGVMFDFDYWKNSINPNAKSDLEIERLMIENYDTAFSTEQKCKNADAFLDILRKNSHARVLTALPNVERLVGRFPEYSDIPARVEVMKENKYRWFERNGVPRSKVITTDGARGKNEYCKNCTDVLFDDYLPNIERWRECGGIGILVT